jgi:hypothetical protein
MAMNAVEGMLEDVSRAKGRWITYYSHKDESNLTRGCSDFCLLLVIFVRGHLSKPVAFSPSEVLIELNW